jgi:hypothetical protein
VYSGIFAIHVQQHAFKNETGGNFTFTRNLIFYALCVLYVSSVAVVALDVAPTVFDLFVSNNEHLFDFVLIGCAEE